MLNRFNLFRIRSIQRADVMNRILSKLRSALRNRKLAIAGFFSQLSCCGNSFRNGFNGLVLLIAQGNATASFAGQGDLQVKARISFP